MILLHLHSKVEGVCPILGLSINSNTIQVFPTSDATPEQIQAANELVGRFDLQSAQAKERTFNDAVAAGYPVLGENYTLPLTTEYQDALNRAKNAFEVAELPDEYLVAIDDISNESHMVSVAKFREILKGYTRYYLGLRAQLKS